MHVPPIVLIAGAILLLSPFRRVIIAALFGRSIGKAALARQPDAIHLTPIDSSKLRDVGRVQALAAEYQKLGFESAGLFTIPEVPGVNVQLLAHRSESISGVIYEHPVAGVFYDVVSRTTGGGVCTHTTAKATGMDPRPNTRTVNLPGLEPAALIERARRERPQAGLRSCSIATAVADFETAYADHIAWIKQRGVSRREVVNVATRKAA